MGVPLPESFDGGPAHDRIGADFFSGDSEGNLLALDSRNGKLLWNYQLGATMHGTSPITYMLDGRQHILLPAGTTLTAWALPQ